MKIIQYIKTLLPPQRIYYLIMLVFGCIFYTTVIANHYYFRTHAFDYADYNFALWDYSHFHMSIVPCDHAFSNTQRTFIQDHFSLTLMYFVPVYWLLNWLTGSYTLLILLVTLILLSGWALYRLIKLKTNDNWLATISVLYYFLLQGRYASFTMDSNILTIICCFIPVFLLCFELKKYVVAFVVFILLLFSREDMPLWFIFIFFTLFIWHRKEKIIVGYCITGIVLSIVYFILLFKFFIPMVQTPGSHYALFQYSALGKTPLEALIYCFEHPIDTIKLLYVNPLPDHLYDGVKMEFYIVYLVSGGFLLFLRPQYFIWFIPLIAQKMFNDDPVRWGIIGYYAIPIVTILPVSVFLIISKFKVKWIRYSLSVTVCVLALSMTWYKMNINNRAIPENTPLKENVFGPKFFHPDYDAAKIHEDLRLIPPDAKICASSSILPHLAQRKYAYEFPDMEDADYIAVFTCRDFYKVDDATYSDELMKYLFNPSWGIIANTPYFFLLKKGAREANKNAVIDSLECGGETIGSDKLHFTASNGELLDNTDTRDSTVKHNGSYSIRLNKNKQYGFTYNGTKFKPGDLLKISVWKYPAFKDTGRLVLSCGKDFYNTVSAGKNIDKSGWEELEMYIVVPEDNTSLVIYTWNDTPVNVWFDDLKIVRCSIK